MQESGRDWLTCAVLAGGEQAGGGGARVDARAEDAAHVYTEQARRGGSPLPHICVCIYTQIDR